MKLSEKIIRSIFYQPKPKKLSDRCEVFLYPETAEKLKRIERILEKFEFHNKNTYKNDYETQKAELFRKIIGIACLVLNQFSDNNKIIIVEKKKKKSRNLWLSSCLKRAH